MMGNIKRNMLGRNSNWNDDYTVQTYNLTKRSP